MLYTKLFGAETDKHKDILMSRSLLVAETKMCHNFNFFWDHGAKLIKIVFFLAIVLLSFQF